MEASSSSGAVVGGLRTVLRLEGLTVFVLSLVAYRALGGGWGAFLLLFLAPDLSFLAALAGRRAGTAAYNAAHAYVLPLGLIALAAGTDHRAVLPFLAIWTAHLGFDRALGYGLKYATAFEDTHLGRTGRNRRPAPPDPPIPVPDATSANPGS